MKNVKKILFYLTIFILIILWQLLSGKTTYDYFWSYGFSLKLANGLVAYRDFNMVTTPFTQMLFALFLFIFGKGIHIYIIFYSLILTLICYLLDVLYGKKGLVVVALMFISPNILPIFMSSCNYNFLLLLLLFILILCERKDVNPLIIGILLGLSFFTKQNIGIVFILVDLIYSFRKKTFLKKLVGIFIVFLIFFAYFILTNSLYDFFDQCFFGLVNFEKENNYHRGIYFYLILIIFGVSIVYVIKNKSLERFLLLAYMFIALPLYDCAHFLLSFYAFVLLFEERRFKIFSKVSIQMIILVFQFILLGNIVITNFKEEAIYPNNIKYLNYFYHPKEVMQKNNQLASYLKKYNTSNIVIFDTNSMYYKLTNDYRSYKYLDLLNNGNFGRLGSINPIKEMRQLDKNTIYVFNPKLYNEYDKYSRSQLDVYTLEYFLQHYKKVDSILDFDIYMSRSEL